MTPETHAIERRLIQLRDNISGAHTELAAGAWRGMEEVVRDDIESKLRAWAAEQEDLRERKGVLCPEPVYFGPLFTPSLARKGPAPKKARWSEHEEYGGHPPDRRRLAK